METKVCNNCNSELPATTEYFYKYKRGKYGVRAICIECHKEKNKAYRQENKEFIAEINKKYRQENRESILEYNKKYRKENKKRIVEYSKQYNKLYYLENKERLAEYDKHRYHNNKEYFKEYYENNKERYKLNRQKNVIHKQKYDKEYYLANKHKYHIYKQKRRTIQRKLPATLTGEQWEKIKKHFNYQCAYCGMTEEKHYESFNEQLHQDHFIPLMGGGEYSHNNIIPACRSCNCSKSNRDFFEWYPEQESYNRQRENRILRYLNYQDDGIQQLRIF